MMCKDKVLLKSAAVHARIRNFLASGMHFDDSEENLAFRIRFLNAVSLIAILASIAFILLDIFEIRWLGQITRRFTELEALTASCLIWNLRGRKHAYSLSAWILLIVSYLAFCSALLYIVNDELRPVWFLIWVVAAYVMLGQKVGLTTTLISMLTILAAKYLFDVFISNAALYTFFLTVGVASGMTYAYTSLANSYFVRISEHLIQLRELANKDPLTGLWNLRFFSDASDNLFAISQRSGQAICLLFIDIDHFKQINDSYGHQCGDHVLQELAAQIAGGVRKSDLVGRIGGEEFVVLMPDTELDGAYLRAEKIRLGVQALRGLIPSDLGRGLTISIGIASARPSDTSIIDMQKRADLAMYEAKSQGRNRVVISAQSIDQMTHKKG